jgi:hypothetical protein
MNLNKPVSGRELARLTGQSEGAVRKAKNRGSILNGLTADGKFIPSIASNEWGKPILKEFLTDTEKPVEIKKPVVKKTQSVKPMPAPKKIKKEAETIEEFVEEIMHEKLPSADADDLDDETVSEELDDRIQKPEAERVTAVLKAKILQITYKEKQGQLIDKGKINPILFGFGQEIRIVLEGLSNRIVDDIRGAKTRPEAKRLIDEEVYRMLNKISDVLNRKI